MGIPYALHRLMGRRGSKGRQSGKRREHNGAHTFTCSAYMGVR